MAANENPGNRDGFNDRINMTVCKEQEQENAGDYRGKINIPCQKIYNQ